MFMTEKKKGPKKGTKYSDKPFSLGKRLYELRKKMGLTQKELAEKVGATARIISYYESAAKNPTIEVIKKLAQTLNVSESYFLDTTLKTETEETPRVIKSLKQQLKKLSALKRREQEALALVIGGFLANRAS